MGKAYDQVYIMAWEICANPTSRAACIKMGQLAAITGLYSCRVVSP